MKPSRLVALLSSLIIIPAFSGPVLTSPAEAASSPKFVVIGDSITSNYNATRGSSRRGWWARLAAKTDLSVGTYAEGGSGYVRKGDCTKTTFYERIRSSSISAKLAAAKLIVIEGGINDVYECYRADGSWHTRWTTYEVRKAAIDRTLSALDQIVSVNSRVYVMAPWGPRENRAPYREEITTLIEDAARQHGFTYVDMADGILNDGNTLDGVHPTEAGSYDIYHRLYYETNIRSKFP